MTKLALRLTVSAAALALPLSAAGFARAADAASDAPVATATATVAALNITAERRSVNVQNAPIAASVLPGAQLQDQGVNSLDDLQFHTPSLTVADFGQGNLFNIRGIGKDLTNVQTPSGVVTYWDGVASFPGFFADAPYYDIANIEVLRGPQGTFAGQNATGGALFITTNDAHLDSGPSADVEGQYGSYNDGLVRGFVNLPINDQLAVRVAFNGERRDSWYTVTGPFTTPYHGTPGRQLLGSLRFSLLWQPTDALRVTFKAQYNYMDHGGFLGDTTLNPANPLHLNPANPFHIASFIDDYATNKGYSLNLNGAYTLPDGIVLRSITAWEYGLGNGNIDLAEIGPGASFEDYGREMIFSEEVNAVSPDKGPLRWVAGLYYQHDYVTLLPGGGAPGFDIGVPHGVVDLELTYRTPKTTKAVFGQITYDITPTLNLQVGARYTAESFGLSDTSPTLIGGVVVADPIAVAHTSNSGVTGKVALTWKPDDANTFYVFVATGRKAAGINTTPAGTQTAPAPFAPETVTDFEGGWKPTFFDGHLRAQIGGYYSLYDKFQLSFGTPDAPTMSFIRNLSGTTRLVGIEAEAQAVFGPLAYNTGVSVERTRLGSAVVVDPVSGLPLQLNGRAVPLAPDVTFSGGVQYAFTVAEGVTLTPRIDYSYVSGQWATPYQDLGDYLKSRSLVNAEIALAWSKYKLTVYATNAFNLHYLIGTNIGLRYAGAPGQYGVRVEARF